MTDIHFELVDPTEEDSDEVRYALAEGDLRAIIDARGETIGYAVGDENAGRMCSALQLLTKAGYAQ